MVNVLKILPDILKYFCFDHILKKGKSFRKINHGRGGFEFKSSTLD
jgi:hypothetical protein